MAITVRFPNGQAVRYNNAKYIRDHGNGSVSLLTEKENGFIVAFLTPGSGALVEYTPPCEVSNPVTDREAAIRILIKGIRGVRDLYAVRDLKRELQKFNAKTHCWTPE